LRSRWTPPALALERPPDAREQFWAAVDALPPGEYYPPPRFDR